MILPLDKQFNLVIRLFFAFLFFIHAIYRLLTMYSTYETLKGYIQGEIQMKPLEIFLEDKRIPINNITKLNFNFFDCKGQQTNSAVFYSLNGQLSNGVRNSIVIYFIDGSERKIFFQRPKLDCVTIIKPLLIEYCKMDLISFTDLIGAAMLNLSYQETQDLKAEYF